MSTGFRIFVISILLLTGCPDLGIDLASASGTQSTSASLLLLLGDTDQQNHEGRCTDNIDNDQDGFIDCEDSDCSTKAVCLNSCTNGILDYGEYWTDCGGTCGVCPSCTDGVHNGDETGIDCGGTCLSCDASGSGQIVDIKDLVLYPYNFRMYLPPGYTNSGTFPLLIFLHGAGERGDNLDQVDNHGPLKHVNANWWNYDFVIIAPQVPIGKNWNGTAVRQLYDTVKTVYTGIDQNRVYITGLSMGGYGVNAIMQSNSNDWVTADAEICGQVATNQNACNYKNTPSWSFACDYDPTVGYAWSISPWAAILHGENSTYSCGNSEPNPNIKISLFDCNSHNSWARVYDPFQNPSNYLLSTDRDVNSDHQFEYGVINGAPPLYDWFLHSQD
jgi:hypothetical protein